VVRSSTNRSASRLKGTGRRGRPPSGWRTAWPSGESASAASRRASGFWADILQRMVRTRAAVVGGVPVGSFLVVVLLAPVVAPYDPLKGRLGERLPASGAHWLGTDELGRDVLSRILHGARITVQIQLAAVGLALALCTALGLTAGYVGRWADQLIMRFMDILMGFQGSSWPWRSSPP